MRQIKFRAQDIASNKWLYGDLRHHKDDVCIFEQGGTKGEQVKRVIIETLEGKMQANIGDMIIKGVKGELYPCKPDIFKATYDKADTDYRDRMRSEHYELNERANKLSSFFQTAIFGNLPDEKKELMREQLRAMREYLGILGKRCELEGIVL